MRENCDAIPFHMHEEELKDLILFVVSNIMIRNPVY